MVRFKQEQTIDGKVEVKGEKVVISVDDLLQLASKSGLDKARLEEYLKHGKAVYNDLQQQASNDSLTGLLNKDRFEKQLKHDLTVARRHVKSGGSPDNLVVMYFDLNGLKHVNDTYGHETGDELLKTAGNLIYHFLRRESDTVARIGGDEFAAILPQTDLEHAKYSAWKLQEGAKHLGVLVAVGMASYTLNVKDPHTNGVYERQLDDVANELKSKADLAMYENKNITKQRMNVEHFYDQQYGKHGAEKLDKPNAETRDLSAVYAA